MLPRAIVSESIPRRREYSRALFWTRISLRALGVGRFGPWRHFLAFVAGTLLISAATATLVHHDYELAESYWQARLQTVAGDRAWVVSGYLDRHLQDAEGWAALPTFRAWLTQPAGGGRDMPSGPTHHTLGDFLNALNSIYAYPGVLLLDSQGQRVASTGDAGLMDSEVFARCRGVVRDGHPQIALLNVRKPLLVFMAPIRAELSAAGADVHVPPVVGVVAIFNDPNADLFPTLETEPVATRTEESVLIRRRGAEAVVLSPLRRLPNSAPVFTVPLRNLDPLVQSAFEGRESVGPLVDCRGTHVMAAVRPISEGGWVLEEKIDMEEAFESFRRGAGMQALCAALLVLAWAAAVVSHRRHQQASKLLKEVGRRQELLRAEKYAAQIVDSVPAWLLVLTRDLRVQSANQPFLTYFDIRQEEIRGLSLGEIIRTEGLLRKVDQAANGQATVEEVLLDVKVRGKQIKLPARITLADLTRGTHGTPEVLLVVQDLTETEHLRLASENKERELRETEARYRALADNGADFIGTHDLEGTILSVTLAVALRAGFKDPQEMVGFKVTDFLPRDRWPEFDAYLETLRREGRAQGMMKAVTPGGEEVMIEFKNSVLRNGREPSVVLCVGRDATELVRLRKALKQAGQLPESLTKTAGDGLVGLDRESRFTLVNERAEIISGYTAEELKGKLLSVLLRPEDIEPLTAILRTCLAEGVQISGRDVTIVRKDGSGRRVRLKLSSVENGAAISGAVMTWRDLAETRPVEAGVRSLKSG
ncbi:MAG TPA: PAS domain S-box protein [Terriglobia bacterium]|nr:PAS domain S-box protein [Terriglobia bacterium]